MNDFEDMTGIPVTILRHPTDTDQRRQGLVTPLQSRQHDPDVFLMDVAWLPQFVASHWLEPIDVMSKEDGLEVNVLFQTIVERTDIYNNQIHIVKTYPPIHFHQLLSLREIHGA